MIFLLSRLAEQRKFKNQNLVRTKKSRSENQIQNPVKPKFRIRTIEEIKAQCP